MCYFGITLYFQTSCAPSDILPVFIVGFMSRYAWGLTWQIQTLHGGWSLPHMCTYCLLQHDAVFLQNPTNLGPLALALCHSPQLYRKIFIPCIPIMFKWGSEYYEIQIMLNMRIEKLWEPDLSWCKMQNNVPTTLFLLFIAK